MSLLDSTTQRRISDESHAITEIESSLATRVNSLRIKEEKIAIMTIPNLTLEEIEASLNALNQMNQEINKQLGALEERIKRDEEKVKALSSMYKELEILYDKNKKYELLNGLIGDAKGAKFSNYAQELTLSRLLALANARLHDMNDRYLLEHDMNGDDLTIIDQYQGNSKRAVKTLSGGESFIISLALALSLSDLASRNVRLDSLFIDEGFGTLDPETLDMALSTLEKLQNETGKTIGVISHVESLKERILTQIKVKKNAQGYSELEVVGH